MIDVLKLTKKNEAYIKIDCEKSVAQELYHYFSFRVPGYNFMPAYKNKIWDGFLRIFSLKDYTIYFGLLPQIKKFCEDRNYKLEIHPNLTLTTEFSLKEAEDFISRLKLPFKPRDYQINAFVHAVRNKRALILSPTASGKSLILYLILRQLQSNGSKKGVLVVPSTSLVEQMYGDFKSYGYDVEKYCHKQYSGKEKNTDKFLTITTWQSIYNREPEYFKQFDFVFGDECHLFKAKSLTQILVQLTDSNYRIGLTGTLDGTQTHKLVLEGLFGSVYKSVTTKELIDKNYLSEFKIKCLVLKYPEQTCKLARSKKWKYQDEVDYIINNKARNNFIKNLAISLKGNSLILFNYVEKHGRVLHKIIKEEAGDREVFFVFGGTDVEVRESIRAIIEKKNDAIIVASYATFGTGINIRNLHNVVFASPSKSRVRNLQSIGRGLRKGDNKTEAVLYDISDDFRCSSYVNTTLKHFIERLKIYDEEKFKYKIYNVELKNG